MSDDGFLFRPVIQEVFTPRRMDVNELIYVKRNQLERELIRALLGSMHVMVYGQSGSGKSWLYKKVLEEVGAKVAHATANGGNIQRLQSVTSEIIGAIFPDGRNILTEITDEKKAGLKIPVAEGGLANSRTYDVQGAEALLEAFRFFRKQAGEKMAVIVIDNLEAIYSDSQLMAELASILLLLDDARYAQYKIKFLLVGATINIKEFFSKTPMLKSVANRIQEVEEVGNLAPREVAELVRKGFVEILGYDISGTDLIGLQHHVHNITLGSAQRVHEYCEQLAYLIGDNKNVYWATMLTDADSKWLKIHLSETYDRIADLMNDRNTKTGRRNQLLYSIGAIDNHTFTSAEVDSRLRADFPESTASVGQLGTSQLLAELSKDESPIIRRTRKGNAFEFTDPIYVACLRTMLVKDSTGKVRKLDKR